MRLFRLRVTVDKFLREEQYGFKKGGRCVNQIFSLRIITEKCLIFQTPLVLSFMDYEQASDSITLNRICQRDKVVEPPVVLTGGE